MRSIVEVPTFHILRSSGETQTSNTRSAICLVEAKPHTSEVESQLWEAYQWKDDVTLRCAVLDASGSIENVRYDRAGEKIYTLKVDGLTCRN